MSEIICDVCGFLWDGEKYSKCPVCLERVLREKNLVTPKHDPGEIIKPSNQFYSKLSNEFITDKDLFIHNIVFEGTLYYNNRYKTYEIFVINGIGQIGGSAIPPNCSFPTDELDGLKIVDVFGESHAYPESSLKYEGDISAGVIEQIKLCATEGCTNYCSPNSIYCNDHH